MESRVLMDDFEFVSNSNLPFEKYRKKVFLITGATGFIGSLLIKNLIPITVFHTICLVALLLLQVL